MSIQLIIEGNHVTDLVSEIQNLATALNGERTVAAAPKKAKDLPLPKNTELADTVDPEKEVGAGEVVETKPKVAPKKPKKLPAKEQREVVEELIELMETDKDPRWEQLSATNQNKVTVGIEAKSKEDTGEDEDAALADMFDDDDSADADEEITLDTIREFMGSYGKDEDGKPIQDNLIAIRGVLEKFIPKGQDVKIGNVPEGQIADLYNAMKKLEA